MRLESKQDLNDYDLVRDAPSRNPRASREPGSYIFCCNLGASAIRFLLAWASHGETTDSHAIYRSDYVIGWMGRTRNSTMLQRGSVDCGCCTFIMAWLCAMYGTVPGGDVDLSAWLVARLQQLCRTSGWKLCSWVAPG